MNQFLSFGRGMGVGGEGAEIPYIVLVEIGVLSHRV